MSWPGEALAARILHAEPTWRHDAFFAYVDRWMTEDDTPFVEEIRKAGMMDFTKLQLGQLSRQRAISGAGAGFVREMWDRYRNNLPPAKDGSKTPPAEETWK